MINPTIPASLYVTVNPGVIGAGGNPLALNGVCISPNILIPTNSVESFASPAAVSSFFGPASDELTFANTYFLGNDNSTLKPGTLFFAPFNTVDRAAWIQSGSFAGVPLATLQAFSGSLTITVDGVVRTAASINLSSATSFSNAATAIQTALNTGLATIATSSAASIAGTTLTVGGTITGAFAAGQTVVGSGVTANSVILSQLTGTTGAAGTYKLSQTSTVSTEAMTTTATPVVVTFSSVNSCFVITSGATGLASTIGYATGTISANLELTAVTGAILSQGAVQDTPTSAATNIAANTQNWFAFTTLIEPSFNHKILYAQWTNAQNQRYAYVGWDTDIQATVNGNTSSFGAVVKAAQYNGTMALYNTVALAAFTLGMFASINFNQQNGRIATAYKKQSGLAATVTNMQIAVNLVANGYSYYGAVATANTQFNFFYNGQISGQWLWADSYADQVYLNSQFQLALLELLTAVNSIPYNENGYSLIRAAMTDPIQSALNSGIIRKGIVLSAAEKAEVDQAAGLSVSGIIQTEGYYLQILDPGAQVRGNRGTPVINFRYTDGGSVQQITLASIDII